MMQRNCRLSKSVWILGLVLLTGPLFSQSSATWSGSAQCQLTLQTNGYTHQEVQAWTITEGQPTQQGAMHVYSATWRASGGGSSQKAQGLQILAMQWNSTVPETSAPIAVFIRASDNRLVIKLWHAQLRSIGGVTGLRQISSGGSSPAQFPLGSDAYEWAFPIIEDIATSSNVNGSGTIVVPGSIMPMQSPSTNGSANCTWQFSKGAASSPQPVPAVKMPTALSGNPQSFGTVASQGQPQTSNPASPQSGGSIGQPAVSGQPPTSINVSSVGSLPAGSFPVATSGQSLSRLTPAVSAQPAPQAPTRSASTPAHPPAGRTQATPPLWGWADLHTHPMSNLAFGGKLFHGAPDSGGTSLMPGIEVPPNTGCRFDVPAADISEALSQDGPTHGDAFQSKCGDFVRNAFIKLIEAMTDGAQQQPGDANGYPDFGNWPRWNDITHQKMWWEWIKRARDGGLRVMVALAHNSRVLGETVLVGHPGGPVSGVTDDASSADLQIREIAAFVNHHTDVMELAMTSADLYRIVQRGHIAVVLGIEVDNLGDFNDKQQVNTQAIDAEIDRLYGNGVRYIFPIHLTDNVFGDTALYDDLFGMANFRETGKFWTVGCSRPGDQVSWHSFGIPAGFPSPPGAPAPPRAPDCPGAGTSDPNAEGNVNTRTPGGLTSLGQYAVKAMMKQGMIIDIDHMSNAAVETTLQIAEGVSRGVVGGGYPIMSGHSGVRNVANFNRENSRTPEQLKRIACLGGMFGLGTDGAKATDWAREYAQAFGLMNGVFSPPNTSQTPGACVNASLGQGMVAFGTDMNSLVKTPRPTMVEFAPGDVPRFADIYNANNPANTDNPLLPVQPKSQTGTRVWDYNIDGVAQYGMLADFVKDVRTAPTSQAMAGKDLVDNHLLHSADYFYRMWQKVEAQKRNVQ